LVLVVVFSGHGRLCFPFWFEIARTTGTLR
jgi:hypothetical protein